MYPILYSVLLYHDFAQNVKYIFVQKGRSFSSAFLFCFLAAEWRSILRAQIGKNMTVSLCVGAQCALRLYVCN